MFQDYHCEPAIFVVDSSEPYFHVQVHFVIFNMCLISTPFHILALRPGPLRAPHSDKGMPGPPPGQFFGRSRDSDGMQVVLFRTSEDEGRFSQRRLEISVFDTLFRDESFLSQLLVAIP